MITEFFCYSTDQLQHLTAETSTWNPVEAVSELNRDYQQKFISVRTTFENSQ